MNRQKTLIVSSIALLILIAVSAALIWRGTSNQTAEQPGQSNQVQENQPARTEITYKAEPEISSLEQLKKEARDVLTKQSDYGEYVESIEGHTGSDDGKYWSFYVDDVLSNVGAGSYIQKGGEEITWKFQKL